MIKDKATQKIQKLELEIRSLEKLIQITDLEIKNFETEVMLIYLEKEGVSQTYSVLNELGHRVSSPRGKRKYTSNDVTELLESNVDNKKIDKDLRYIVNGMLTRKHKHIKWMDLMLKIVNEIE